MERHTGAKGAGVGSGPNIRKLTYSAVFLAAALVFKTFLSFYIPLFGERGMKIGISGVFTVMPAILFGPVYGAIIAALSDFLGFILNPSGAYLPLMTLVLAFGGFLNGGVWLLLKNIDVKTLRLAVLLTVLLTMLFGLWNMASLNADGITSTFYDSHAPNMTDMSGMRFISRLLLSRTASTSNPGEYLAAYINFTTYGPVSFSIIGLALILVDIALSKQPSLKSRNLNVLQILITMLISCVTVSTLNTLILRNMLFESWKLLPFAAVWLPRVIEAVLNNAINAYFVAFIYGVFSKTFNQ